MIHVLKKIGNDDLATVYIATVRGKQIEFAESIQPPLTHEQKWVLIISCMIGCPVKCLMCDAGQECFGPLTKEEMLEQIDYMVERRYPDRIIPVEKFKVQFTRMGEPVFNPAVLDVLEELPNRYCAPSLIPSFSTVAPKQERGFLNRLKKIKNDLYGDGRFQMQFSIHTTDDELRDRLIPIKKLSFEEIAEFGKDFYEDGDRKITLNFIVMNGYPLDPAVLKKYFDPSLFLIKLTPLNPTKKAAANSLETKLNPHDEDSITELVDGIHDAGFETLVSIGALEENKIGSNCGQYVSVN